MKKSFLGYNTFEVERLLKKLKSEHQQEIDQKNKIINQLEIKQSKLIEENKKLDEKYLYASSTIINAQQEARNIKQKAQSEADIIIDAARQKADKIMKEAKELAAKVIQYTQEGVRLVRSVSQDIDDISKNIGVDTQETNNLSLPGVGSLNLDGVLANEIISSTNKTKELNSLDEYINSIGKFKFVPIKNISNAISKDEYLKCLNFDKTYVVTNNTNTNYFDENSVAKIDEILSTYLNKEKQEVTQNKNNLDDILNSIGNFDFKAAKNSIVLPEKNYSIKIHKYENTNNNANHQYFDKVGIVDSIVKEYDIQQNRKNVEYTPEPKKKEATIIKDVCNLNVVKVVDDKYSIADFGNDKTNNNEVNDVDKRVSAILDEFGIKTVK